MIDKLKILIRQKRFLLAVMVIGGVLVFTGLFRGIRESSQVQIEYLSVGEDSFEGSPAKIIVDVEGAVVSPGVYELDKGSRIKDALVAAGGLSDAADRTAVSRMINLAEELKDAQKIYFPNADSNTGVGYGEASYGSKLINVNTASVSELDTLWGIGEARAQAIIDGRPYGSLDELVSKKLVSQSVLDKNEGKMTVY